MGTLIALWMTLLLGLFLLIGAGIVFLTKNSDKFVDFSISLAFSVVMMMMITDLIPESFEMFGLEKIGWLLLFVGIGFLLLRLLDFFIPDHEDDPNTSKDDNDNLAHIGLVSSIALILHNIIEGMAIYSTFTSSISLGIILSIGVGLHNIPLGMVIASAFYRSNQSKFKTFGIIIGLSLSTFFGGLILFLIGNAWLEGFFLGALLAITLGMLIYIGFFELLPRLIHSKNKKMTGLGILSGILLLVVVFFL